MLYNLYRPTDFSEVKGQEDVLVTMKRQAQTGKFGHAYLLAGHRGTGKTTIARILSKAINCENPTENGPCKVCESCLAAKSSMDIKELDAATNNGVDHIKELTGQTKYRPVQLKNKVFIIDEVHNLSTAAFDTLISGDYKLLVEPLAFVTFQGRRTAMTATEAALFDRLLGGTMQRKMPSLSHKNLPLSIFLETSDLGFPAWSGSRTERVTNESIIEALGVGIVRFNEQVTPEVETVDYEYRVNTDVITAVSVRGGQSDPDHPVNVTFQIDGASYTVQNVYYPEGREQLVWVRWHTPPTPQIITILVTATGSGSPAKGTLVAKIVDLDGYDPPNPTADDRNDSYSAVSVPSNMEKTAAHWSIWRPWWQEHWVEHTGSHNEDCTEDCTSSHSTWEDEGWWEFDIDYYSASFSADMSLTPDEKSPTASATTIKSGYGVNIRINAAASASEASAVTEPQTAVSYFPEFYYETYWRLLERTSGGMNAAFQFKPNEYSTYNRRTHFTPIWMKDGSYTVYTYVIDCWTPDGMLCKNLTGSVGISGDLWKDWHIAPKK